MFGLLALILAAAAPAIAAPSYMNRLDPCVSATATIATPCAVPVRFAPGQAQALLAGRESLWWLTGDRLTLIGRPGAEGWAMLCCAIQTPLEPIGDTGLAGITVRVPRMREALIDVVNSQAEMLSPPEVIRGPEAPPAPPRAEPLLGTVVPLALESDALGEKRVVTIYLPPGIVAGEALPVIYLADGNARGFAPIAEAAVRDGRAAPAIIVGIDSAHGETTGCRHRPCDRRMLEYMPDSSPDGDGPDTPFGRHLRFVTDQLIPYVEANYPASARREDRIVAGYSNGAVWAFATAALRPDLFGNVLGMSAGGKGSIDYARRLKDARLFTGAGLFEPNFLRSTRARADLARSVGAEVAFREIVSGHSPAMWDILFADGIAWLLPPRP